MGNISFYLELGLKLIQIHSKHQKLYQNLIIIMNYINLHMVVYLKLAQLLLIYANLRLKNKFLIKLFVVNVKISQIVYYILVSIRLSAINALLD